MRHFSYPLQTRDLIKVSSLPKIAFQWWSPFMDREGNRNCRSFLVFLITMPIYSIRKTDNLLFSHNDITDKPFLGYGPNVVFSLSSTRAAPGWGVSLNLFLETCAESACSPRAASAPTSTRGCLQTQSAVVKEERMSGMTLHSAVMA